MNLSTETYLYIANILPVGYLVFKTVGELYKPAPSREILANWVILIVFLWTWNLFEEVFNWSLYLLIGAIVKTSICLVFDLIMERANRVNKKYELEKLKNKVLQLAINVGCDWNFYLTRVMYKSVNDQEKRLMKDRYNSVFEELASPSRVKWGNAETQTDSTPFQTPKDNPLRFQNIEIKPKQVLKVSAYVREQGSAKKESISFKKVSIDKKEQKVITVQQQSEKKELSMRLSLRQSHIELQDVLTPSHNSHEESTQIRRMNTFSHSSKEIQTKPAIPQQLNMSISEQYSHLLGSDDEGISLQTDSKPLKAIQKRQIRRRQFKKEITVMQQQPTENKIQKQLITRIEIYLQTGNSYYQLERKIMKLYKNDEVEILSIQNVVIDSFKLVKLKPMRNQFYQLKGETLEGSSVAKTIRFRGQPTAFAEYIQTTHSL